MIKPVRARPQADTEIDALADYIARDNLNAALRFLDAVQKFFDLIGEQPGIGSWRYAHLPMMEGLRMWPVSDFEKHLIFWLYVKQSGYKLSSKRCKSKSVRPELVEGWANLRLCLVDRSYGIYPYCCQFHYSLLILYAYIMYSQRVHDLEELVIFFHSSFDKLRTNGKR